MPADVNELVSLAGVHAETVMSREYVNAPGIRRIIGGVDQNGRASGGIELALDSLLRGDSALSAIPRDVRGRRLDNPDAWAGIPRSGGNVTLTINRDLQDICERALARAVDSLDAAGGDIVVVSPATGEVLAMASRRLGRTSMSVTAVTEPFEPGSTLKPFIAAALLDLKRARTDEVIDTHNGVMVLNGRTITDVHKARQMPLSDVIRFSSNIGIVGFSGRLTPREKYETLRDLGFGASTGTPLPGESDGTLREPARWSQQSEASIVMGYELSVTPLQLAIAYAALANGGELLQPHIVKEIRGPDGELVYRAKRRAVRRVFTKPVADVVRGLLKSVVDSGTAVKADLAAFAVAGKSGTARRTVQGQGYVAGNYTASFVGLFPAERPQYVILIKLDSPRRAYYGGEVAAPVTSVVLRAALAARNAALDRAELASVERDIQLATPRKTGVAATSEMRNDAQVADDHPAAFAVTADLAPARERTLQPTRFYRLPLSTSVPARDTVMRAVPDIRGLSTRNAVRALHGAGFRVTLSRSQAAPTVPEAGSMLAPGSIIRLHHIP